MVWGGMFFALLGAFSFQAAMNDEGKALALYAGQLEDELFHELRQGGTGNPTPHPYS